MTVKDMLDSQPAKKSKPGAAATGPEQTARPGGKPT